MEPGVTRRSSAVAAVCATLALTALVVLLGAWAASVGPDGVVRGAGPGTRSAPSRTPLVEARRDDSRNDPVHESPTPASGVAGFARGLLLPLAAALAVLTAMGLVLVIRHGGDRLSRAPLLDAVDDGAPPASSDAIVRAMSADAEHQEALLGEGTVRNGIVECWHRFEVQAAHAGLPRRQAETTSEFTLRLLDLVEADASAVARLAALYREARFSEHELDESDRDAARTALDLIHAQLRGLLSPGVL